MRMRDIEKQQRKSERCFCFSVSSSALYLLHLKGNTQNPQGIMYTNVCMNSGRVSMCECWRERVKAAAVAVLQSETALVQAALQLPTAHNRIIINLLYVVFV